MVIGGSLVWLSNSNTPPLPTFFVRINCGGIAYTDTTSKVWQADAFSTFTSGNGGTFTTPNAIFNTEDDFLYQSERWGALIYELTVPNGTYTVNLLFAEVYADTVGQRQFNVLVEGVTVATNLDLFALVGRFVPYIITRNNVVVSDGILTVTLAFGAVDNPKISAIEVIQTA